MTQARFGFDQPDAAISNPPKTAESLKREGMQQAAKSKNELLEKALEIARNHPNARDGITMDDVVFEMRKQELPSLGNAAGSVFLGKAWEFTGERRKSTRLESHGNELKVWRLK